jgi:hypothetical protein
VQYAISGAEGHRETINPTGAEKQLLSHLGKWSLPPRSRAMIGYVPVQLFPF